MLIKSKTCPPSDITPEAALAKLSYVLGKESWSHAERRRAMDLRFGLVRALWCQLCPVKDAAPVLPIAVF